MADTAVSCIRLIPYRQFADSTWGSILVVNWLSDTPSVFLFDSPERKKDAPNSTRNNLLPVEAGMYARYMSAVEKGEMAITTSSKDIYAQYGVAPLAGDLISAHIADLICENLNAHNSQSQRNVNRANDMLAYVKAHFRTQKIEKELQYHLSPAATWERSILEQTLPLITSGYDHGAWIQSVLASIPTKTYTSVEEKGIRAVLESGICKSKSDWGAVFKMLVELRVVAKTSYLAGATIINRTCEQEVTTASAIKQSPALVIIGGTAEKGWTDKVHNRQSANLLIHYRDIAEIFRAGI